MTSQMEDKMAKSNFKFVLLAITACTFFACLGNLTSISDEKDTLIFPQIIWMDGEEEVDPDIVDSVKITINTPTQQNNWSKTISFWDREVAFNDIPNDVEMEMKIQGIDIYGIIIYEGFRQLDNIKDDKKPVIVAVLLPPVAPIELQISVSSKDKNLLSWKPQSSNFEYFEIEKKLTVAQSNLKKGVSAFIYDTTTTLEINIPAVDDQDFEIRVRAWNLAGFSDYSEQILINGNHDDTTSPSITVLSHSNPDTVNSRIIKIFGTVSDRNDIVSFTINDIEVELNGGLWELPGHLLEDGKNIIEIAAIDKSENRNITTRSLILYYDPDYNIPSNNPPHFVSRAANLTTTLKSGKLYSRVLKAIDPDPYNIISVEVNQPLTLVDDSLLHWIPTLSDTGVQKVIAIVTDQDGAIDSLEWEINVLDSRINTPPQFLSNPKSLRKNIYYGETYSEVLKAVDLDQDSGLVFEVINGEISIDKFSGKITWEPVKNDMGSNLVSVRVKDDSGSVSEINWTINVLHPNIISFSAGEDINVSINDTVNLNPVIDINSGSVIKYEWDFGNTGEYVEISRPDTQIIVSSTPISYYPCVFRITLAGGDLIQDQLIIVVNNDGPSVWFLKPEFVPHGQQKLITGYASDKFGKIIKWEWKIGELDDWVNGSDKFIITMPAGAKSLLCVLRVTDDDGNTATASTRFFPAANQNMSSLQGGTFTMGSNENPDGDENVHQVKLSAFKMDVTEISQLEYFQFMGVKPSGRRNFNPDKPVGSVTWFDAILFSNARSKSYGLDTVYKYTSKVGNTESGVTSLENLIIDYSKKGYRLPTEAEWEYAAKAGSSTAYFWGNSEEEGSDYAVFDENSGFSSVNSASTQANAFELHDMAGNVWEWTNDWYDNYLTEGISSNPKGAKDGVVKAIRGGSWQNTITELRSANRQIGNPGWKSNFVGFRTVLPL